MKPMPFTGAAASSREADRGRLLALMVIVIAAACLLTAFSKPSSALDAWSEDMAGSGFSGAVLVARGGEVILHAGYGMADREQARPFTADTAFTTGSITKQFTAAAILRLEEQGKLSVDDAIGRFFDEVPEDKQGITLHHLLTHTSGLIGDIGDDYEALTRDALLDRALASTLQWAPGTRYDYSNLGYSLLGAVIELVSGQSYERYIHEQLFVPAGMERTGYRIPRWAPGEVAVGYRGDERWGTPLEHPWAEDGPWWNLRANGGVLSTLGDLHRWHRALDGDTVLSEASRRKLFTPHVPEDEAGSSHYGYGWALFTTVRDTRLAAHDGSNGYFYADFRRYMDEDVLILYVTNDAGAGLRQSHRTLVEAVFSGPVR